MTDPAGAYTGKVPGRSLGLILTIDTALSEKTPIHATAKRV